jgi:signal transduction histidine kinase
MTGLSPFAGSRAGQGAAARAAHSMPGSRAISLRAAVPAAAVIAAGCVTATVFALAVHASPGTTRAVLAWVTAGMVLMLVTVVLAVSAAARRAEGQARAACALAQRGQSEIQQMAALLLCGERPALRDPAPARDGEDGPFQLLISVLDRSRYAAGRALLQVADNVLSRRPDQRVEIFVNLARRMQSLVHREIELLDGLEAQVEDPDLLKGLFTVDHLATRMRRQSESLAVLGGSVSRRQWTRQVTMHEVLRAAVAEVEHYSRVKVVPPVEGVLHGTAVADVIHVIAELVENATKFSPPRTQTLLRAQEVAAGIAVEVEDRGLGMLPADQQRMNELLAEPGRIDIGELLRDGRIGLYVVAALAGRHGIRVQLQGNIYGGTSAVVILPGALLETGNGEYRLPLNDPGEPSARELAPADGLPAALLENRLAAPVLPAAHESAAGQDARVPRPGLPQRPAEDAGRPPLPRRHPQASLAPQLHRDQHSQRPGGPDARTAGPPADQMPGLMADFLKGVGRSGEEDHAARD